MNAPFTPGQYLTRRRTIAGLGLTQAAASAAAHPACQLVVRSFSPPLRYLGQHRRTFDPLHKSRTLARLIRAEEDKAPLTFHEAEGLAHVIPLDPAAYLALVDLHLAGAHSYTAPPSLCRTCACSQFDPCGEGYPASSSAAVGEKNACGWAEADLCSACAASPRQLEDAA